MGKKQYFVLIFRISSFPKSLEILGKEENSLDYAYFIENTNEGYIDNSELFQLISDLEIEEDYIFIDTADSKDELNRLLEVIETGNRLFIRSIIDFADDAKKLVNILYGLQDNKIILCSVSEPLLPGDSYYTAMQQFININTHYLNLKRKKSYEEAKQRGCIGRPPKTAEVEKAIRLYNTKSFTIAEIEALSGVSSSTLFRYLREQEN